jgi:hypothetical protein
MADFGYSFGRDVALVAKKMGRRVDTVIRTAIFKTFSGIIMDTGVIIGRLKGNWQVSSGAPILTTIDRIDKSGAETEAEAKKNINPKGVTYMTNNLPYAARRNKEGFKGGVNALFVEKNFARIGRNMKEAARG